MDLNSVEIEEPCDKKAGFLTQGFLIIIFARYPFLGTEFSSGGDSLRMSENTLSVIIEPYIMDLD